MSAFSLFAAVAALLVLAAVACVAVPLWRDRARSSSTAALTASCLLIPALALLVYAQSSNHEWAHEDLEMAGAGQPLALGSLVGPLRARLEQSPEDAQGWMLLGVSYSQLGDYPQAVESFDRVLALTGGRDPDALMGKAEALILENPERILQEAGGIVEQVLQADPSNPKGLWYGGLRASAQGETVLAVQRWRAMLEGPVTPEVRNIVERELNRLGASAPVADSVPPVVAGSTSAMAGSDSSAVAGSASPAVPGSASPAVAGGAASAVVELRLRLEASTAPMSGAVLFIVARIPGQTGPPLAARRVDGARFPLAVSLSDADAMLPGATVSDKTELAITARLSATGQTTRAAGDHEAQGAWQAGQGTLELELRPIAQP